MKKPSEIKAKIVLNKTPYTFSDEIVTDSFSAVIKTDGDRVTLALEPKGELSFDEISLIMPAQAGSDERIFMNGYQSWTDSREYHPDEKQRGLHGIPAPIVRKYNFDKYGDYNFADYPNRSGELHGFTYCYFRTGQGFLLIGSLSERQGFTEFRFSSRKKRLTVSLECEGASYSEPFNALDLFITEGSENEVFDHYFDMMHIPSPKGKPITGYTSWYRHYQDISEKKLMHDLDSLSRTKGQDIFQIDDGYQCAVGDWLDINKLTFPDGLEKLSSAIHEKGLKAGLWLAPFVCEKQSEIYKNKKHWLLHDKEGNEVPAGCNWSGSFALDIYNEEVRAYLKEVFDTVLNKWGFDLVKLDFLYAACIIPQNGRSRGQVMCEAMDFLRECVGSKLILGCGVPLGAAFGKVEYCRIGCDVGLDYNDNPVMQMTHRERVSTKNSMLNTVFRRQLDGRAFYNDPDVFLLRDDNISLFNAQKQSLAFINHIFGSVYFTSDDVASYGEWQKKTLATANRLKAAAVRSVTYDRVEISISITDGASEKQFVLFPDGKLGSKK